MKSRMHFIDLLKSLAIFGVITIHISAGLVPNFTIGSLNWYFYIFWASIVRWSVPVFFMCSGVLFLNPDKNLTIKQIYSKYLKRIIIALIFWAFLYEIFDVAINFYRNGSIASGSMKLVIKNILTCNTHFHLYYLYIMILIYTLVPIIRTYLKAADRQHIEYVLVFWVVLGIIFPFAIKFYPFTLLKGIVLQYSIRMAYSAVGYFILGHYLVHFTLSKKMTYAIYTLGVLGIIVTISGTALSSVKTLNGMYLEGMSLNVAAMAAAVFLFCKNLSLSSAERFKRLKDILGYISKASFCIYLVHDFFNMIFRLLNIDTILTNVLVAVPLLTILNLILSLSVYFILFKIPVMNKYLI